MTPKPKAAELDFNNIVTDSVGIFLKDALRTAVAHPSQAALFVRTLRWQKPNPTTLKGFTYVTKKDLTQLDSGCRNAEKRKLIATISFANYFQKYSAHKWDRFRIV